MAKRRSERLAVVLMVARRHEQEAAGYLQEYRQLVETQHTQLTELQSYQQGYLGKLTEQQRTLTPGQLEHYSRFIHNLDGMLEEQQLRLQDMQGELEKVRLYWLQQHHRCQSINDLIERLREGENRELEKRLQKELDEMAAAALRRPHQ